jgi:hypothetical protein
MPGGDMKRINLIIGVYILSFMGCATLPHYEEKWVDSRSEDFKNVAFEQIWIYAIDSILEMDYKISTIDKTSGLIYGERKSTGMDWPDTSEPATVLSIVIKDLKEKVTVECRGRGGIINKSPQEINERFFSILKNKLKI